MGRQTNASTKIKVQNLEKVTYQKDSPVLNFNYLGERGTLDLSAVMAEVQDEFPFYQMKIK